MGAYHLERFDGVTWRTFAMSPDPICPDDYSHADPSGPRDYPSSPQMPGFAGLPGYKARVRFIDDTTDMELELYDWAMVPSNPYDDTSEKVWGWKCVKRATYPAQSPIQKMKVGVTW